MSTSEGFPWAERECCLLGVTPTSLGFLRSKVCYLPTYGTVKVQSLGASSHYHNCCLEAQRDLSGSVKVEWQKGQDLKLVVGMLSLCVCLCGGQASNPDVIPHESSLYFLRQSVSHWDLGLPDFTGLSVNPKGLLSLVSASPEQTTDVCAATASFLLEFCGRHSGSLLLQQALPNPRKLAWLCF